MSELNPLIRNAIYSFVYVGELREGPTYKSS